MAIKYSFVDNVTYGTDDVNAITKDLTGAGIAPFPVQDAYNTSDLNALTEALVSSGTSLEGCKCTVSNITTANMEVTVSPGIIFFESGVRLTVDSYGYVIHITPNTAGYVFAHYSPALQTADIKFDTVISSSGEAVLLAEISASGVLTDRRSFARSKVATFGANIAQEVTFSVLQEPIFEGTSQNSRIVITRELKNVDLSKFNYAFISARERRGFYDLREERFLVHYTVTDNGQATGFVECGNNVILPNYNGVKLEIIKRDNALMVRQSSDYEYDKYGSPITAILM